MIYHIPVETGFEMRRKIFPPLVFLPLLWYAGIRQKTTGVDTMAEQEMLLDTCLLYTSIWKKSAHHTLTVYPDNQRPNQSKSGQR